MKKETELTIVLDFGKIFSQKKYHVLLFLITLFLRMPFINNFLGVGDSDSFLNDGVNIKNGVIPWWIRPPLFSIFIGLMMILTNSESIRMVKFAIVLIASLAIPIGYEITKILTNKKEIRWATAIILALNPLLISTTRWIVYQNLYTTFSLLTILYFLKFKKTKKNKHFILTTISNILCIFTYLPALTLSLIIGLGILISDKKKGLIFLLSNLFLIILFPRFFTGEYYNHNVIYDLTNALSNAKGWLHTIAFESDYPLFKPFFLTLLLIPYITFFFTTKNKLIALYPFLFFLPFATFSMNSSFYVAPIVPLIIIFAFTGASKAKNFSRALLLLLFLIFSTCSATAYSTMFSAPQEETHFSGVSLGHLDMIKWIKENIEKNKKIGVFFRLTDCGYWLSIDLFELFLHKDYEIVTVTQPENTQGIDYIMTMEKNDECSKFTNATLVKEIRKENIDMDCAVLNISTKIYKLT